MLREEGPLSARVRNDDAAVGVCERYYPRDGLVFVDRWQRHVLHDFRNSEELVAVRGGHLFFRKSISWRCHFFFRKNFFVSVALFRKIYFFQPTFFVFFDSKLFLCFFERRERGEVARQLLVGVLFGRGGVRKFLVGCLFLLGSGRWVGVTVCVVARHVRVIGPFAVCRVRSGASVRRHQRAAAPCASGGGRSISCTMVHRACAVQCAGALRVGNSNRRMVDTCLSANLSRRCVAYLVSTNLFFGDLVATF